MYSKDGGVTWVKTELDLAIDYVKNNGWKMSQGEFATKGNLRIEFDFHPQTVYNGKDSREWCTLKELKIILSEI